MSRLIYPKGHIVKGATVAASFTKELHRNTEVLRSGGKAKTVYAGMDNCVSQEIDLSILPAAAESYQYHLTLKTTY